MDVPKVDLGKYEPKFGWMEEHERVTLRCPNGHVGDLSDHTIAIDGMVTPSVQCPKCGFHEHVKLIGY